MTNKCTVCNKMHELVPSQFTYVVMAWGEIVKSPDDPEFHERFWTFAAAKAAAADPAVAFKHPEIVISDRVGNKWRPLYYCRDNPHDTPEQCVHHPKVDKTKVKYWPEAGGDRFYSLHGDDDDREL